MSAKLVDQIQSSAIHLRFVRKMELRQFTVTAAEGVISTVLQIKTKYNTNICNRGHSGDFNDS